jgi:hypothetical protein
MALSRLSLADAGVPVACVSGVDAVLAALHAAMARPINSPEIPCVIIRPFNARFRPGGVRGDCARSRLRCRLFPTPCAVEWPTSYDEAPGERRNVTQGTSSENVIRS